MTSCALSRKACSAAVIPKALSWSWRTAEAYPLKGSLQFSDVTVDESTGSITLRAIFPNPQHVLLPGDVRPRPHRRRRRSAGYPRYRSKG